WPIQRFHDSAIQRFNFFGCGFAALCTLRFNRRRIPSRTRPCFAPSFPLLLREPRVMFADVSTVALRWLALVSAAGLAACPQDSTRAQSTNTVKTETPPPTHAHTNRLAREKSPYLLQHQFNPVD